jgi:hypothetical protein
MSENAIKKVKTMLMGLSDILSLSSIDIYDATDDTLTRFHNILLSENEVCDEDSEECQNILEMFDIITTELKLRGIL